MGELVRHENWPSLLSDFIEQSLHIPFDWGQSDCSLFAANAVLAMTGTDHAAEFRGRYKTAREATQLLKAFGGVAGMVERSGLQEVNVLMAQRGDVVLVDTVGGDALGVVALDGRVACQGPEGITFLSPDGFGFCAKRAWRV